MLRIWRGSGDGRLKKIRSIICTVMLVLSMFILVEIMTIPNATAGTVPPSTISVNTTWNATGSPYWIEHNVTVLSNVTLTIEAGVNVRFDGNYSLIIDGDLVAIGNASSKINFTSNKTIPEPGDWQSIRFNKWQNLYQYNSTIKYATIEYATYGVYCNNRSVAVENSMVTAN
jgi:hypothetical protein